jgi:hypothetical protein
VDDHRQRILISLSTTSFAFAGSPDIGKPIPEILQYLFADATQLDLVSNQLWRLVVLQRLGFRVLLFVVVGLCCSVHHQEAAVLCTIRQHNVMNVRELKLPQGGERFHRE